MGAWVSKRRCECDPHTRTWITRARVSVQRRHVSIKHAPMISHTITHTRWCVCCPCLLYVREGTVHIKTSAYITCVCTQRPYHVQITYVGSRLLQSGKHSLLQQVYDCEKIHAVGPQFLAVRANRRPLDRKS